MQGEHKDFVHVLLFECPSCRLPVMHALTCESKNIENIDMALHSAVCGCGWSGKLSGLEAKRHWIEPWSEAPAASPDRLTDTRHRKILI
ncbi:MAG: hypothetical protein WB460_08440 [Candidatus Acidiferrales bacterium]